MFLGEHFSEGGRQGKRIKTEMKLEWPRGGHSVRVQRTERIARVSILPDGPLNAARLVAARRVPPRWRVLMGLPCALQQGRRIKRN